MYRAFDYNGKRKLSEQIIDGIAEYVKIPDGGTGLDVGCGSGALTIACAKRNPKRKWSAAISGVAHTSLCLRRNAVRTTQKRKALPMLSLRKEMR